jgi:hypothetical protein
MSTMEPVGNLSLEESHFALLTRRARLALGEQHAPFSILVARLDT